MAKKKTGAPSTSGSTRITTIKAEALTQATEATLLKVLGSRMALATIPGAGGEIVREPGVTRVTGRDYATGAGTVPASEIYFVKGARPREEGPWLGEADKVAWLDPATGYECIMMRDKPDDFSSGYVGVPQNHPLFGWEHEAVPADLGIEVHGGLTYSRICQDGPSPPRSLITESRRICHVAVGYAPLKHATGYRARGDAWWFGFSCDHIYDVVPGRQRDRGRFMGAETAAEYRDDAYVVREILNLASQLKAIADGVPVPARDGPPLPAVGLDPQQGG